MNIIHMDSIKDTMESIKNEEERQRFRTILDLFGMMFDENQMLVVTMIVNMITNNKIKFVTEVIEKTADAEPAKLDQLSIFIIEKFGTEDMQDRLKGAIAAMKDEK